MKLIVEKSAHLPGATLSTLSGLSYSMSDAQAAALEAFCLHPNLGDFECLRMDSGTRSGVEVASCTSGNYTVLFTRADDVQGELVTLADLRQTGRLLRGIR